MKWIVTAGPMTGAEWQAAGADVTIGRDPSCDFVLPDDALSRAHCRLLRQADGWTIVDLESTNGVKINGKPVVGSRQLRHGDRLQLGRCELAFEADPNRPVTRAVPVVATAEKDSPLLICMTVAAAALLVVVLLLSARLESRTTVVAERERHSVAPANAEAGDEVAAIPAKPRVSPASVALPPGQKKAPKVLPRPKKVSVDAQPLAVCPSCQIDFQTVRLPADHFRKSADSADLAQVVAEPVDPLNFGVKQGEVVERLASGIRVVHGAPGVAPMTDKQVERALDRRMVAVQRRMLRTDRLLSLAPRTDLADADAATVTRLFDDSWSRLLRLRPTLDRDAEIARQRRLKSKALSLAVLAIAEHEQSAELALIFPNSPDCWEPVALPSPPVMRDWVPTKGLQGRVRTIHDGETYALQVRHEVKGYDYGYYEPGKHFVYRLTITLNDETLLQKVYDLRSIPQPPARIVLGPDDLPGRVQRTASNSLFRHYADDCGQIYAPNALVKAKTARDPIASNFISRIPKSAWDYKTLDLAWRRNTNAEQWKQLIQDAIRETIEGEFGANTVTVGD